MAYICHLFASYYVDMQTKCDITTAYSVISSRVQSGLCIRQQNQAYDIFSTNLLIGLNTALSYYKDGVKRNPPPRTVAMLYGIQINFF